jgi:hypothetical protein
MSNRSLQKRDKPQVPNVSVDAGEEVKISDEEALECFERQLGCIKVGPQGISDLEKIGIYVRGVGVLKLQRGNAMINQQFVKRVLTEMVKMVEVGKKDRKGKTQPLTVNDICALGRALGYLSSKLTESQKFAVELERVRQVTDGMTDEDEPPLHRFVPGKTVTPTGTQIIAQEVHMHQAAAPAVSPAPVPEKV